MKQEVFRLFVLFLVLLNIQNGEMSPGKNRDKKRSSIFDDSIFKNRVERCLEPIRKNPEMEELMADSEEVLEQVPLEDSQEELNKDTKEVKEKKIIKEEKLMRRFVKCMIGKRRESVVTVSYQKKEEEYERVEGDPDRSETVEMKVIEPVDERKIVRRESILTGIKTEIGTTRLPEDLQKFVDVHDELAVPGTSKGIVRIFPSVKAMEEATRRRAETLRMIKSGRGEKDEPKPETYRKRSSDDSE